MNGKMHRESGFAEYLCIFGRRRAVLFVQILPEREGMDGKASVKGSRRP